MEKDDLKTNVDYILGYLQKHKMNAYLIVERSNGTSSSLTIKSEKKVDLAVAFYKMLVAIYNDKEKIERDLAKILNTDVESIRQSVQDLKKMK